MYFQKPITSSTVPSPGKGLIGQPIETEEAKGLQSHDTWQTLRMISNKSKLHPAWYLWRCDAQ